MLGLCAFMLGLSPRLTMLALLEVPLAVTARKVYDTRHQVIAGMGWWGWGDRDGGNGNGMGTVGVGIVRWGLWGQGGRDEGSCNGMGTVGMGRAGWGSWVQHSKDERMEKSGAGMEVGWRVLGHPMGADTHCPPQMLQRAVLDAAADTGAAVQESISSIEMVRVFNGEEEEEHRYSQVLDRTLRLRDQRDTERAIFLLIQRVRLTRGDTLVSGWDRDIPAEPHPHRCCSWPCRHWCCTVGTSSSARGPSLPAASLPSSSTRLKLAAACR